MPYSFDGPGHPKDDPQPEGPAATAELFNRIEKIFCIPGISAHHWQGWIVPISLKNLLHSNPLDRDQQTNENGPAGPSPAAPFLGHFFSKNSVNRGTHGLTYR